MLPYCLAWILSKLVQENPHSEVWKKGKRTHIFQTVIAKQNKKCKSTCCRVILVSVASYCCSMLFNFHILAFIADIIKSKVIWMLWSANWTLSLYMMYLCSRKVYKTIIFPYFNFFPPHAVSFYISHSHTFQTQTILFSNLFKNLDKKKSNGNCLAISI